MSTKLENYKNSNFPHKEDENSYIIPVQWSVYSTIRVEAANLQEALDKAREKLTEIPITPNDCEYIDDSYLILADDDDDLIRAQDYHDVSDLVIKANGDIVHE